MKLRFSISFLGLLTLTLGVGGMVYLKRPAEAAAIAAAAPSYIIAGQPTEVTVTIQVGDPQAVPESVNPQRVDANGTQE